MKLDIALPEASLPSAQRAGESAARLGFGRVWTTETTSDPFLQALVAYQSGAPSVATGIAVAFARTPMVAAYPAWDLAEATQGGFTLGLGSQVRGHIERRFSMPWGAPVRRMRDYVLALRAIWQSWRTGEPLSHEGPYYTHTLMPPVFTPPAHEHAIPIGLAGVGPQMTELAGEVADVLLVHPFSTVEYFDTVTRPALAKGCALAGRPDSAVTVYSTTFLVMGDTEEELRASKDAARERIAFYGSTPSYRPVLESIGQAAAQDELYALAKAKRWKEMSAVIDDAILGKFAVIGTPEQLPELVRARHGGRLDRISSYTGWPDLDPDRLAAIVADFNAETVVQPAKYQTT